MKVGCFFYDVKIELIKDNDYLIITALQLIGDHFVATNKFCVLQIPSVVTFGDFSLLTNSNHSDFSKIEILEAVNFPFDKRIFG